MEVNVVEKKEIPTYFFYCCYPVKPEKLKVLHDFKLRKKGK